MTDTEALVGRILGQTYRVERQLGRGGMGAVLAAAHVRTGRRYALKVLLPEIAARRDAIARFRREAEAIGALGHANIVAIHDFAEADGLAYLVMDLLDGEDLEARLERRGRLPLAEALLVFEQIASGLAAAHERGLVHRDLKPANVFLARQPGAPERAVILDFGLAKSLAHDGDLAKLTASGVVMGTPQYMSPEQASGEPLDARADLYSLATILFEMLAGAPPFTAPTLPALFAKLATEPAPPLSRFHPDLPAALGDVLARALAKSPHDRYPDAWGFVSAVRVAVGATPVPHTGAHPVITSSVADPHADTVASPASSPVHRADVTPARTTIGHPRSAWPWLALGAIVLAASLGGALSVALFRDEPPVARTDREPTSAIRDLVEEPREVVTPVRVEPASDAGVRPIVEAVEPAPVVATRDPSSRDPSPRARRAALDRSARDGDRSTSGSGGSTGPAAPIAGAAPAAPSGAPPSGTVPPGAGPPAGVQEAVAYMQQSDWRGCIRATHAAPRSPEILGARMSCSLQASDRDELRATCAEMRTHYPSHPQTQSCAQILRAYGWE